MVLTPLSHILDWRFSKPIRENGAARRALKQPMHVKGIDHFHVSTRDLDRLCDFYVRILGFELGERPPFNAPGAWLYAAGRPILHVGIAAGERGKPGGTGPIDHVALEAEGLVATLDKLDGAGIGYRVADVPGRLMKQVFLRDPDGVLLELNFSKPDDVAAFDAR